eukprot:3989511-Pleurochrysis_carterae.AAC.1
MERYAPSEAVGRYQRYGNTVAGCTRGGATVGGRTHEETKATVQGRQSGGVGILPERVHPGVASQRGISRRPTDAPPS